MIFGNRAVLSLAFSASASLRASAFAVGARSCSPARPIAASALFSTANIEPSRAMKAAEEARQMALAHGYSDFEAWLTSGGDDRSLIKKTAANKVSSRLLRIVLYASLCIEVGKNAIANCNWLTPNWFASLRFIDRRLLFVVLYNVPILLV